LLVALAIVGAGALTAEDVVVAVAAEVEVDDDEPELRRSAGFSWTILPSLSLLILTVIRSKTF